ncbi:hypothetical protein CRG98_026443 [Punica granatum]|uniref:Uncharacterized protein n=1 Tax=Punica granatum TaxID=22663 RepID=A0A2I0JA66_PUNGR|nr:hypothetical protein CRG98_026443 [Punica granatum]
MGPDIPFRSPPSPIRFRPGPINCSGKDIRPEDEPSTERLSVPALLCASRERLRRTLLFCSSMAATAANSSSPSVRCSLLPHRPIPSRPSFFKPISSVNTNRSIGFSGLSSSPSPTAIPLQRWGCFPTLAREGKLRLRMPAVSGSLGGNEDETDQEAAVTDTESVFIEPVKNSAWLLN